MRLFVAGDVHGNTRFLREYLYPKAVQLRADVFVQLGDFGYWEHTPDGVDFLDDVADLAARHRIPMYWLRGNHDNIDLCLRRYGDRRTEAGFVVCRPDVLHIPDGMIWTWAGTRMRAFGGAYSIDKQWRLDLERKRWRAQAAKEEGRRQAGLPAQPVPSTAGTIWFPQEELSDDEFDALLAADSGPLDVVLSHDKPFAAVTPIPLKDLPECHLNQRRLQRALTAHRPALWLHGHLHFSYTDRVMCDGDDRFTTVIGLSCDDQAADRFWRPWQSWCVLDLAVGEAPRLLPSQIADDALDREKAA